LRTHPYIRAYLAGIAVPTLFLLIILAGVAIARFGVGSRLPVERFVVFPMAVVPNMWGVWNVLSVRLAERYDVPAGALGAVLPLVLAPMGFGLMRLLELEIPRPIAAGFPFGLPVVMIAYYLAWKYLVGFLNGLVGIEPR
jgi:hypothetical protein